MLYIVEIPADGDLTARMGQMRTWLDHLRYQPGAFRSSSAGGTIMFGVEVMVEAEARALGHGLGGRVYHVWCRVHGRGRGRGVRAGLRRPSSRRRRRVAFCPRRPGRA